MATAPSGTPSKWFMELYFYGFIAGIMDYENIDDATASSSTTCLDQQAEVKLLSAEIESL